MTDATVVPAAAAAVVPAAAAAAVVPAAAAPWHGVTDPEGAAYVTNKGWQNTGDVIKSYQGAEKLIGKDPATLLVMPRADDPVGMRAVFSKLGMPETADKYAFAEPKTAKLDPAYMNWARESFHKIGLTAEQGKALSQANNEYIEGVMAQQVKDYELTVTTDKQTLAKEWGGGFERMMNAATTAAKSLDFTGEMIDGLEQAIGYANTMKFFSKLGQRLSEDGFVGGDTKTGNFTGILTPEEAKAQWEAMKLDPVQSKALFDNQHPSHKATKEKQNKLFAVMFPQGSNA